MRPIEVAIQTVLEAGRSISHSKPTNITLKRANDYVTSADLAAEDIITRSLHSYYPDDAILTEEARPSTKATSALWYVDPLSSTANFIHGLPHCAVAIAREVEHDLTLAVVHDPTTGNVFWAERGKGAFLGKRRLHVAETDQLDKSLVFANIGMKGTDNRLEGLAYFERIVSRVSAYRRVGSTALEMCYVAAGCADAYLSNAVDIFADMAGKLLVEEAGGVITDFANKTWSPNSTTILASNGAIHDELVGELRILDRRSDS
jgi:myo-inositol-1(or 4)-monophosphatase